MRHRGKPNVLDGNLLALALARAVQGGSGGGGAVLQADWYLDGVAGNDANPGTPLLPVRTISGGIVPKWKTTSPVLTQNTTIHVVGGQTLNQEAAVLTPIIVFGANFAILGTQGLSLVRTTALGGVTAKNRATSQRLVVTGIGAVSPGQLVLNTSRSSSWAMIDSVVGANSTLDQPLSAPTFPAPEFFVPSEDDTWAPGDTVQIYNLPLLNLKVHSCRGGDQLAPGDVGGAIYIQDLLLPDASGTPGVSDFILTGRNTYFVQWVRCYIETALFVDTAFLIGLKVEGQILITSNTVVLGGSCHTMGIQGDGNILDLDLFVDNLNNASTNLTLGFVCIGSSYASAGQSSALMVHTYGPSYALWGSGNVVIQQGGGIYNIGGTSWATTLIVTGLLALDAAFTGTSYAPGAPGVFTDGRALTSANLDTYVGLQNPITGSRFAIAAA